MGDTCVTAEAFSPDELTTLWNDVYEGYWFDVRLTAGQLQRRFRVTDIDRAASVILVRDGAPAGFSLLGVRGDRGWIGGFGVVARHRGQGLAHRILARQIDIARERAPAGVQLEVLEQNPARALYEGHGFAVTRRLAIMRANGHAAVPGGGLALREVTADAGALACVPTGVSEPRPCWQREPEPLLLQADAATHAFAVMRGAMAAGLGIVERTGAVMRLASLMVSPEDAADALAAVRALDPAASLLLVNEPEGSAVHDAALRDGWETMGWQLEMHRVAARGVASL